MKAHWFFGALLCGLLPAYAQNTDSLTIEEFEASLEYQHGEINLGSGLATLQVPPEFRYLNPEQTDLVLVNAWGNPPGRKTLGMLLPSDLSPLSLESWGVVITYEEDGYVKDDEADRIDYAELLREMQENTKAANEERAQQGYEPVVLLGWATPPHYDRSAHKLYWAKELQFGKAPERTLNYHIRALGRRGVLVLTAVAAMPRLKQVETDMQKVLRFVEFNEGHRYADFDPEVDKVAAYGIGALIAGKIAAKAGFFKLLLGLVMAGKKFILLALIGLGSFLNKVFNKRSGWGTRLK